jgi:hypothetical protein
MKTTLTASQESKLKVYREKWLKIGLCTDPIDFELAKKAVCSAYKCAGLEKPKQFYYAASPVEGTKVAKNKCNSKVVLSCHAYGCHDAFWLCFYDFFLNELNLKCCEKLTGLIEVAKTCGWWIPFGQAVVIEDRPTRITFDYRNLLHREDGPAIEYRDGFSVYAWHGHRVPKKWIEEGIEPTEALQLVNVEDRRVACEIIGWDTILKKLKTKIINKGRTPEIGELLEVTIPDVGKEKFLRVRCGTGRSFAIPVPKHMKSALEANAWTYGVNRDTLKNLEVRT